MMVPLIICLMTPPPPIPPLVSSLSLASLAQSGEYRYSKVVESYNCSNQHCNRENQQSIDYSQVLKYNFFY